MSRVNKALKGFRSLFMSDLKAYILNVILQQTSNSKLFESMNLRVL